MSLVLMAPHEAPEVTCLFPSPNFGDSDDLEVAVNIKRSMDGTTRTYVKTSTDELLIYDFILTRAKIIELQNFVNIYYDINIRMINHKGEIYVGKILNQINEYTTVRRGEEGTFRLEFRGVKIA